MTQTKISARSRSTQAPGPVKLTGRGAVVALFAACLLGLLIAAWTGWTAAADVIFIMSGGLVAYYTKASGLRVVVVCPPLVFLAGSVCAQLIAAPDTFSAAEGIWVTLATSAPWLFTGTALVAVIAFGRGYRPNLPGPASVPMIAHLLDAMRSRRRLPLRGRS
jgi:hypothetical protein